MNEQPGAAGAIGVTDFELAALVDMNRTDAGRRALEALGIAGLLEEPVGLRAGYASLLVRDLAGLDGEEIVAAQVAGAIGTMITGADDIITMTFSADGRQIGRSVLIDSPWGAFLVDLTTIGVHTAQALQNGVWLSDLVRGAIENVEELHPAPFEVVVTRFPVSASRRTIGLGVADGDWRLLKFDVTGRDEVWDAVLSALGPSDADVARAPRRAAGSSAEPGDDREVEEASAVSQS